MNKYAHIARWMSSTVWAILPAKYHAMTETLSFLAAGGDLSPEEIKAVVGAAPRSAGGQRGTVAVLPLLGVIAHRSGMMNEASGGTSIESFAADLRSLLADQTVKAIVLEVDSPGGDTAGVEEMAAEIYQARGAKPIVAVANTMAASAAYWIASAASEFVATPSAQVGSIGVFAAHEDQSAMMDKVGVRTTLISAGKYKVEGNPYEPLTNEARAAMQDRVDQVYDTFVRSVAHNRRESLASVRNGYGEGRIVGARQALEAGMIDRIATLDEVVAGLASGGSRKRASGDAAALTGADMRFVSYRPLPGEIAGPMPNHKSPGICPRDAAWDGPGEIAAADQAELHLMCAWFDSAGPDDDSELGETAPWESASTNPPANAEEPLSTGVLHGANAEEPKGMNARRLLLEVALIELEA